MKNNIQDPDLLNDSLINDGSGELFIDVDNKIIFINKKCIETFNGEKLLAKTLQSFLFEECYNDPFNKNIAKVEIPCINLDYCNPIQLNGWEIIDKYNCLENL